MVKVINYVNWKKIRTERYSPFINQIWDRRSVIFVYGKKNKINRKIVFVLPQNDFRRRSQSASPRGKTTVHAAVAYA